MVVVETEDTKAVVITSVNTAVVTDQLLDTVVVTGGVGPPGLTPKYTTGSAVLNFGAFPGSNESSVVVTGQTSIVSTSVVHLYIGSSSSTTNHTADDHKYFAVFSGLSVSPPTPGSGFTIYARSIEKLSGQWLVNWAWI